MAHLGAWGRRHLPVSRELAIRAELLEAGGPDLWDRFMDELRERHLGLTRPAGAGSVRAYLQAAYDAELAVPVGLEGPDPSYSAHQLSTYRADDTAAP
jgi:hypothetical protein